MKPTTDRNPARKISSRQNSELDARQANADVAHFADVLSRFLSKVHGSEERAEASFARLKGALTLPNLLAAGLTLAAGFVAYRAWRAPHSPALLDE